MSEIGEAVGDATMHHSSKKNGDEYAGKVTKVYVKAAGEIGLAGYKIGNIASFGVTGFVLDAVVEGDMVMCMYPCKSTGPISNSYKLIR